MNRNIHVRFVGPNVVALYMVITVRMANGCFPSSSIRAINRIKAHFPTASGAALEVDGNIRIRTVSTTRSKRTRSDTYCAARNTDILVSGYLQSNLAQQQFIYFLTTTRSVTHLLSARWR